jgi:hypothetical protein
MIKFKIPVDRGNDVIRTGKINSVFEQLMPDLKPEAVYLYPDIEDGQRSGMMVFDLQDPSEIAGVVERFAFGLHATVQLTPVMVPEDLRKALATVPRIVENYG